MQIDSDLKKYLGVTLLCLVFAATCSQAEGQMPERTGDFLTSFSGQTPVPRKLNPNVSYRFTLSAEMYFVHVSPRYRAEAPYGLIVFTDANDELRQLPEGWQAVLDRRKYLFIAAQNAGNRQNVNRRLGLAVVGALEMMQRYRIDPHRVYAAGFSGGARMSSLLGFFQSDVFRGTIQNCGTDFYRAVPMVAAKSRLDTAGQPYGMMASNATRGDIAAAKQVRFALITGTRDFRRGNIVDIYRGGFSPDGFRARLFDVPGMEHDVADGPTLSAVLDFLEGAP